MNTRLLRLASRFATLLVILLMPSQSQGVVVVSDSFGDGDLNNDGTVLGPIDADWNNNGMLGDSITPADPAFTTTWNEITAVTDSMDTGIRWLHSRGWTGNNGDPNRRAKAFMRLVDDSTNLFPDSTHPTYPVNALNGGPALGYESTGRGSSVTGFFGQNIALGSDVGDRIKVSFDYRTWLSTSNDNTNTGQPIGPPRHASLRFGLFQDTDNQIGLVNDFAGIDENGVFAPATWGVEGGHFRGDLGSVGAVGDNGWFASVDLGRTDWAGDPNVTAVNFDGIGARINEEQNPFGEKLLEGAADFVAKTDEMNPTFTALDVTKRYNLALTLERATETNPGDTIKATFEVTDLESGTSWLLEGTERLFDSMMNPDGISSDNWDYFAIRNSEPVGSISPDGDDFDFIIDNFLVEEFLANAALFGDYDGNGIVGAGDLDLVLNNWGVDSTGNIPAGWVNDLPVGIISAEELDIVLGEWGNTNLSAVPEPSGWVSLLILGLAAVCRKRTAA